MVSMKCQVKNGYLFKSDIVKRYSILVVSGSNKCRCPTRTETPDQNSKELPVLQSVLGAYPSIPSSMTALYWKGISMRAAKAKAASFAEELAFLDIISVKLTNCINREDAFNITKRLQRKQLDINVTQF